MKPKLFPFIWLKIGTSRPSNHGYRKGKPHKDGTTSLSEDFVRR